MTDSILTISQPDELICNITSPSSLDTIISTFEDGTIVLISSESLKSEIVVQEIVCNILASQGPAGPPGLNAGEEMKYAERIDFVGEDIIYKGEAHPGSLEDEPKWRICKVTFVGEDMVKEWANGEDTFNNMWSSHLTLTYI